MAKSLFPPYILFFVSGCDFCCLSLKKRDWRMLERTCFCFYLSACVCLWALFWALFSVFFCLFFSPNQVCDNFEGYLVFFGGALPGSRLVQM